MNVTRDVDTADDSGWTPLIIACSAGHTDIVHMLVEKGAKVRHDQNNRSQRQVSISR